MLKSELVISEDLNLLESYLKRYSARFISNIFSDEGDSGLEGYKEERSHVFSRIGNQSDTRARLIPQMMNERDLFPKVQNILLNKELDIDPVIINNITNQIENIKQIIEYCCVTTSITKEKLDSYYEESLVLLIYFSAIRSHVLTLKNLCEKFKLNETACVLCFNHLEEKPLSIIQQKT